MDEMSSAPPTLSDAEEKGFHLIFSRTTTENEYSYQTAIGEYRLRIEQENLIGADGKPCQEARATVTRLHEWRSVSSKWLNKEETRDFGAMAAAIDRRAAARERYERRRAAARIGKESDDG